MLTFFDFMYCAIREFGALQLQLTVNSIYPQFDSSALFLERIVRIIRGIAVHSLNESLKIDHWVAQRNHWYGRVEGTPAVPKWGIRSKSHGGNQNFCPFFHIIINKQYTKSCIAHVWVLQNCWNFLCDILLPKGNFMPSFNKIWALWNFDPWCCQGTRIWPNLLVKI